jgi:glucosyl-dolichyl phosphate glucuronosyltransferase
LTTKITIAVPTHNRADSLARTLASLGRLTLGDLRAVECLVIDNDSTDHTAAVVEQFSRASPLNCRRIFEPRLGSSFARNRAIDEAAGDFLLFIDDDAVAEPAWAAELTQALERGPLDAACGLVLPQWGVPPPPWLGPRLYPKLAIHDEQNVFGQGLEKADALHNYFSVNLGLRRSAVERFGRFREDLGVRGRRAFSGEDTELFARIIGQGGKMGFVPSARVYHFIEVGRMRPRYLMAKSFAFGVGSALAGGRSHNRPDKLLRNLFRTVKAARRADWEGALYHQLECANFFGYWWGRFASHRKLDSNRGAGSLRSAV